MNKEKPTAYLKVTEEVELMSFLIAQLPHKNRNNIKTLLRDKQILVEGRVVTQYNHLLKPNQKVEISGSKARKEQKYTGVTILFEDPHLIVIDKQEGVLSIATDNREDLTAYRILSNHVKLQHPSNKIFVVHRLDRDTSGVMVFAKSDKVQQLMQESWGPTTKERTYLAVVEGMLAAPSGTIISYLNESKALIVYSSQNPQQGQKAVTHYETIKANRQYSLLKVNLETGRKNQIRVHCQDLGHPIVGDKKYGSNLNPIGRLGLHAWVLGFTHPITKEKLRFETKIPPKFLSLF
jgi:23S rRNA pseudouridine1911/1915/1917 synthase